MRRTHLAAVLAVLVAFALPAETAYAFSRLFDVNGTSGRPLTLDQGVVFDWLDRTLGTGASVTMVPYPVNYADYWASVGWWWDLEFWNKSVDRAAYLPGQFLWTPSTFPRVMLRFDPTTGVANASPTPYVVAEQQGDALPDRRDAAPPGAPTRATARSSSRGSRGGRSGSRTASTTTAGRGRTASARVRIFGGGRPDAPGDPDADARRAGARRREPAVHGRLEPADRARDRDRRRPRARRRDGVRPARAGFTDVPREHAPARRSTYGDPTNRGHGGAAAAGRACTSRRSPVADEIGPRCRRCREPVRSDRVGLPALWVALAPRPVGDRGPACATGST